MIVNSKNRSAHRTRVICNGAITQLDNKNDQAYCIYIRRVSSNEPLSAF